MNMDKSSRLYVKLLSTALASLSAAQGLWKDILVLNEHGKYFCTTKLNKTQLCKNKVFGHLLHTLCLCHCLFQWVVIVFCLVKGG